MIVVAITGPFFTSARRWTYAVGGGLWSCLFIWPLVPFDPDTLRFEGIVRRHLKIMTGRVSSRAMVLLA